MGAIRKLNAHMMPILLNRQSCSEIVPTRIWSAFWRRYTYILLTSGRTGSLMVPKIYFGTARQLRGVDRAELQRARK